MGACLQRDAPDLRNIERLLKGMTIINNFNNFCNRRGEQRGKPYADRRPMKSIAMKGCAAASGRMGVEGWRSGLERLLLLATESAYLQVLRSVHHHFGHKDDNILRCVRQAYDLDICRSECRAMDDEMRYDMEGDTTEGNRAMDSAEQRMMQSKGSCRVTDNAE